MPFSGRRLLAAALLVSALPAATVAEEGPIAATAGTVRDFMIQNVCLDAAGAVRIGRSPIDGGRLARDSATCFPARSSALSQARPSLAARPANRAFRLSAARFVSGRDAGLGTVVEHSFDFGDWRAPLRRLRPGQRRRRCRDRLLGSPRRGLDRRDRRRRRCSAVGRRMPRRRRPRGADPVVADPRIRSAPAGTAAAARPSPGSMPCSAAAARDRARAPQRRADALAHRAVRAIAPARARARRSR